jgi:CubicO group peptidase (beta-lactamase class C family)
VHSFLRSSCRDLARFGHLILRQGNWDGTQVVSSAWVTEATRPSQDLDAGFGLLWWLNRPLVSIDDVRTPDHHAPEDLRLIAEAPENMIWSVGTGGQILQIPPRTDTVVVRMGTGLAEVAAAHLTTRIVNEALPEP